MASYSRSVRIVYEGKGRDILWWWISTAFFSLITLGLYLPVAINRLVRYIFDNTELLIQEPSASGKADAVTKSSSTEIVSSSDG